MRNINNLCKRIRDSNARIIDKKDLAEKKERNIAKIVKEEAEKILGNKELEEFISNQDSLLIKDFQDDRSHELFLAKSGKYSQGDEYGFYQYVSWYESGQQGGSREYLWKFENLEEIYLEFKIVPGELTTRIKKKLVEILKHQ